MQLIATHKGTLQDAYDWAIENGMDTADIESVREGAVSHVRDTFSVKGKPERYFRFTFTDGLYLVGAWRMF